MAKRTANNADENTKIKLYEIHMLRFATKRLNAIRSMTGDHGSEESAYLEGFLLHYPIPYRQPSGPRGVA
jgi:hypothetical protein